MLKQYHTIENAAFSHFRTLAVFGPLKNGGGFALISQKLS
jgi:hypothetical protein